MSKFSLSLLLLFCFGLSKPVAAQTYSRVHELFPFLGLYAPDRFQSSMTVGVRYENHLSQRFAFGGTIGFAKAEQKFFQQAVGLAVEQGSATVIFYNGRIAYGFPLASVIPYLTAGLGVTRQHSESNLTVSLGVGTKIPVGEKTYLRWEMNDHIFSSGQDNTAWTNNNLEFSAGISFFLQ